MADITSVEELNAQFTGAVHDDTPIAVNLPNGGVVSGDPKKVGAVQKKDYEITLYLPVPKGVKLPQGTEIVMNGTAYKKVVSAKQKFISSRIGRKVRSYASTIALAFTNFQEDGTTNIMSAEDYLRLYNSFNDDVIDACEKLVVEVLGLSPELVQYVTDYSLIENCGKIMQNNPSFFQDDVLFD